MMGNTQQRFYFHKCWRHGNVNLINSKLRLSTYRILTQNFNTKSRFCWSAEPKSNGKGPAKPVRIVKVWMTSRSNPIGAARRAAAPQAFSVPDGVNRHIALKRLAYQIFTQKYERFCSKII